MTAAEKLPTSETTYEYPLADIREPSVPNYRTTFEGIEDLTASVKESGIQIPLVLRPAPDGNGHELAIGARRREAAKRAGLTMVPVFIREMDDEQVLVARTIENLQRVDPGPLDEAEGFAVLQRRGWSVGQLAAKVGQPTRYVLERLTLCNLCKEGRESLTKGEMLVGVAIEVAKLAPSLQKDALEEVAGSAAWRGGLSTVADAREAISKRVMLELANAPFQLDDATLVPAAGPCTTCPKRTGGQADLFPDFATDLCTDSACHKGKLDAHWQIRVKQAKADGHAVLPKKDTDAVLRSSSQYGHGELMRLDETIYNGGKKKTLKKLFGDELPPITLARDEDSGVPVELVPRKAAERVIRAFAPRSSAGAAADKPKADAKAKAEREAERLKAEVNRRAMTAIVEAADSAARQGRPSRALLRLAIRGALDSVWTDVTKKVADRRGLPLTDEAQGTTKKGAKRQLERLTPALRIERLLDTLDEGGLFALLLELAMGRSVPGKWSEGSDCYVELCTELGVNPKGLEAVIKAELKVKKDKGGKTEKAPAKPKVKLADRPTGWPEGSIKPKAKKPRKPKAATDPREQQDPEDDGADDDQESDGD